MAKELLKAALQVLLAQGIVANGETLLASRIYPEQKVVLVISDGRKFTVTWADLADAEQPPDPLLIRDVPTTTIATLIEAGYTTLAQIAGATDAQLLALDGVGQGMLKRIRAEAPALEILPADEAE